MNSNIDATNNTTASPVDLPELDPDLKLTIEQLTASIHAQRVLNFNKLSKEEMRKYELGNVEISFLNNLKSILALGADPKGDGSFEMNDKLRSMINKSQEPGNEHLQQLLYEIHLPMEARYNADHFAEFFKAVNELGNDSPIKNLLATLNIIEGKEPSAEELKKLSEAAEQIDNEDLRKLLLNQKILHAKDKFTKVEKDNIIESIRLSSDLKNSQNNLTMERLTRLEAQLDQMYEYLMACERSLDNSKKKLAGHIKG